MRDKIKEQISALVDGELDTNERPFLIKQIETDESLRADWERYHLISDVLKGQLLHRADAGFAESVINSIEQEPVVTMAQRNKLLKSSALKYIAGIGIAASVAMVAVLIALPDSPINNGNTQQVAVTESIAPVTQEWVRASGTRWDVTQPAVESRLNSYLVNHNEYSNGMQGVLPYARIVGYDSEKK
ncbi:MAG: RseA family anti-sigma factor [Gammaproteobacteria bacterium]|nr:RseA family anti-sigma factor [Gammaproteobacteria bacterium]